MRQSTLVLIILLLSIASCVPTSKITYLQESKSTVNDSLMMVRRLQPPYRLQVNDVVNINLYQSADERLTTLFSPASGESVSSAGVNGYGVDLRGDIRLPEIGTVKAIGLTTEELQDKLKDILLEKYFKQEEELFLTVKLAGISFTMVGEVSGTGIQSVQREQVNIIEAIAAGGGVPATGDLTAVKIVRNYPDGVKVHEVDLTTLDVVYSPYYYIQPNDMIVVDPLPQKQIGIGTTGLSAFSTIFSLVGTIAAGILLLTR
ncbi:protein involved in gliding motility EpsA [Nonlabens sp. Hel1_33_55]|uniref:polysaccharide biosynthesis/export family protein n=1 Tax=Nonlabens sp. Hel1_33_55 TaxID=1336802 RepID=UPI000875EA57|nr:polysaccharide biosynthesis/export family protein [Nonlabens sp. Hel1_33_55]SCX91951.1 protein involved in gliding motility EpsA [Nonlabens sp. Hel1_33_55]